MLRFYAYKGCDGCRKARKWLVENDIDFTEIAIRETPPTLNELEQAYEHLGNLRLLFNTSGMDYRQQGLKDTLPTMQTQEALQLLNKNGNLVKRPFLVGPNVALTGFKEEIWSQTLR